MFTKLDMIGNHLVFINYFECCDNDVISDITADQFRLEFSIFRTFEYINLISLHLVFTKLDIIDDLLVLTNSIQFHHDDVISDVTVAYFRL